VPPPQRATLLRLSSYVHPDGVIIITGDPTRGTDNRSSKWLEHLPSDKLPLFDR
jgi:hypothetical protein